MKVKGLGCGIGFPAVEQEKTGGQEYSSNREVRRTAVRVHRLADLRRDLNRDVPLDLDATQDSGDVSDEAHPVHALLS